MKCWSDKGLNDIFEDSVGDKVNNRFHECYSKRVKDVSALTTAAVIMTLASVFHVSSFALTEPNSSPMQERDLEQPSADLPDALLPAPLRTVSSQTLQPPTKNAKEPEPIAPQEIPRDQYLSVFISPPMIHEMCQSSKDCTGIETKRCEGALPDIVRSCFHQFYPPILTPEIVLNVETKKKLDECLVSKSQTVFQLDDETVERCRVDKKTAQ